MSGRTGRSGRYTAPGRHLRITEASRTLLMPFRPAHRALTLAVGFLLALAFAGGASRGDEIAQVLIRIVALLVLAALLIARPKPWARPVRPALIVLGAAAALVLVQLMPLPPALWQALPGRALYASIDEAVGLAGLWRPITLSPDRSWNALLSLLVPLAMLAVLARLRADQRTALLPWLLVVVALSVALMLLQLAVGGGWLIYAPASAQPPVGLFPNRNHQALLLAQTLPLLAVWTFQHHGRIAPSLRLWLAIAGLGTLLVFIPATGSRAGLVLGAGALIGTVLLVGGTVLERVRRLRRRMRRRVGIGAAVGAAVVLAVALGFSRATSVQRLLTMSVGDDARQLLFPRVVEMGRSFFPVGSGFGAFDPAFRRFERLGDLKPTYFNQAHNDLAQVVVEGGLPALLLLVIGIALIARRSWTVWRRSDDRSATQLARAASLALLLVVVASALDYPLRTPLHMALAALLAVWLFDDPPSRVTKDG